MYCFTSKDNKKCSQNFQISKENALLEALRTKKEFFLPKHQG